MNALEKIRLHYPLPIAKLCENVHLESEPRQRVHKLIDLFERTVQYLVLVGLASCRYYGKSDPRLEALRPGLARPSLGHWVALLKALSGCLRPRDPKFLTAQPGSGLIVAWLRRPGKAGVCRPVWNIPNRCGALAFFPGLWYHITSWMQQVLYRKTKADRPDLTSGRFFVF